MPSLESQSKVDAIEKEIRQAEIRKINTQVYQDFSDLSTIHDPLLFKFGFDILRNNIGNLGLTQNDAIVLCKHLLINTINNVNSQNYTEIENQELNKLV